MCLFFSLSIVLSWFSVWIFAGELFIIMGIVAYVGNFDKFKAFKRLLIHQWTHVYSVRPLFLFLLKHADLISYVTIRDESFLRISWPFGPANQAQPSGLSCWEFHSTMELTYCNNDKDDVILTKQVRGASDHFCHPADSTFDHGV